MRKCSHEIPPLSGRGIKPETMSEALSPLITTPSFNQEQKPFTPSHPHHLCTAKSGTLASSSPIKSSSLWKHFWQHTLCLASLVAHIFCYPVSSMVKTVLARPSPFQPCCLRHSVWPSNSDSWSLIWISLILDFYNYF